MSPSERAYEELAAPHSAAFARRWQIAGAVVLAITLPVAAWMIVIAIEREFSGSQLGPLLFPAVFFVLGASFVCLPWLEARAFRRRLATHPIVWVYRSVGAGAKVCIVLSDGKPAYDVPIATTYQDQAQLVLDLAAAVPGVLVGFTPENELAVRRRFPSA